MLSTLMLVLDRDDIDYRQASLLQGVMFEQAGSVYAAQMHQQNMHPYSQYVMKQDGKTVWVIHTLTDEAGDMIIRPLYRDSFHSFKLKQKGGMEVHIIGKSLEQTDRRTLLNDFYQDQMIKKIRISLLTPTAFKQGGRYFILPDLRLVFQNLMMRYSASSDQLDMVDEDTLEELAAASYISGYRLSSRSFPMEHTWIPGFMGEITIGFSGGSTVSQYAQLLLKFGEFSGIGIKTGMGMGAMHIMKEKDNEQR